ncbi:hypothetical protein L0F63_001374, partial [Massospora cicadina]
WVDIQYIYRMPSYNRSIVIALVSLLASQSAENIQSGTYHYPGTVQPDDAKSTQPPVGPVVEPPRHYRPEIATDPVPKVEPEGSGDAPKGGGSTSDPHNEAGSKSEPAKEIQQEGVATSGAYSGYSNIKPDTDPLKADGSGKPNPGTKETTPQVVTDPANGYNHLGKNPNSIGSVEGAGSAADSDKEGPDSDAESVSSDEGADSDAESVSSDEGADSDAESVSSDDDEHNVKSGISKYGY